MLLKFLWQREKFCVILDKAVEKFIPFGYWMSEKFPKWMNKEAKAARKNKSKCGIRIRN
jgi:hypothetical protein